MNAPPHRPLRCIPFLPFLTTFILFTTALLGCGEEVEVGSRSSQRCESAAACDDGVFCNGVERCAPGDASADGRGCVRGEEVAVDDGDPCTHDVCDEAGRQITHAVLAGCERPCERDAECAALAGTCRVGVCRAGSCEVAMAPAGTACDDGTACTDDACDATGACVGTPIDSECFDDAYCNGLEECRPERADADGRGCVPGIPPVPEEDDGVACTGVVCDEDRDVVYESPGDTCECTTPGTLCDDPDPTDCVFFRCTDALTCAPERGAEGAACDDGVACTVDDVCDAQGGCAGEPEDAGCDDGAWCNGGESCAPEMAGADARGCVAGRTPTGSDGLDCTEDVCDEAQDRFIHLAGAGCECVEDADCVPAEPNACLTYTCEAARCAIGSAPADTACDDGFGCTTDDRCDGTGQCAGTQDPLACNDGAWCNGVEACRPTMASANAQGCVARTAPLLDDGVACTADRCVECDPTDGCSPGLEGDVIHDPTRCGCQTDADCSGASAGPCELATCSPRTFECELRPASAGTPCDDGLDCTTGTICDSDGRCLGVADDGRCDDDLFCNGVERCAPEAWSASTGLPVGCADGADPTETWPDPRLCLDLRCDEATDMVSVDETRCGQCVDTTVYVDADSDGFGSDATGDAICLLPDEPPADGLARTSGDCGPTDPWRNPDAEEICGDWLDDDCDDLDAACPSTAAAVVVPSWSCGVGQPPSNVYAWARLPDNNGHYANGGCVLFFAAPSGAFFAAPVLTSTTTRHCSSFDERLYAFTLSGPTAACPPITIEADFSGRPELAMQPVSNDCRKFLHALVRGGEVSYVASSEAVMARRVELFGTVEIACSGYRGWPYGWQSLMTAPIERNPGFVAP